MLRDISRKIKYLHNAFKIKNMEHLKNNYREITLRFLTLDFGNPAFRGLASMFHILEIIFARLITVSENDH